MSENIIIEKEGDLMRKFILFVSVIIFSLIFVNNKAYAQQLYPVYPPVITKLNFSNVNFVQENEYTYEYEVYYYSSTIFDDELTEDDYYLIISHYIPLRKGINRDTNSYELEEIQAYPEYEFTNFVLRVTLLKSFIIENGFDDLEPNPFFRDYSAFYVTYDTNIDYQNGYEDGLKDGYEEGYEEGYNDGYNDFNIADHFGDRNIAKDPDIIYSAVSDAWDPSIGIILINKGYGASKIVLDKPYIIVIIKKNIYDYVVVVFDDGFESYHYEATYLDMGEYDIYVFNFPDRVNSKYELTIRKENITTSEQLNQFLNDVKNNIYFSHASKLLNSSIASQVYHFGYLVGLEENVSESDAYRIGYDTGYNRGYTDGNEIGYERGYEDGYKQGFDYGKTTEYEHGYKDGYKQGSNDAFLNDVAKWFGPMVLIVLIAGAYVTARNRRSED